VLRRTTERAREDESDLCGATDADLSETSASKNERARRGSSKTSVRETFTWRIESSHV